MANTIPKLNYVGATDIMTSTNGSTLYNILIDADMVTNNNILMFEYKLQEQTNNNPVTNSVTLGFINIENAIFQSGIQNQWGISVPAENADYDPNIPMEISVRVYAGSKTGRSVVVSEWSNALKVHNPPPKPTAVVSFYDTNNTNNLSSDLYVFIANLGVNYNTDLRFIVAYYYQDNNNATAWHVSDLIPVSDNSTEVEYNGYTNIKMLQVPNFGLVSTSVQIIKVAVYAVYSFTHNDGDGDKHYHSVSQISDTIDATSPNNYSKPGTPLLTYNVYNTREQTIQVSWTAPVNSVINSDMFTVANYKLECKVNNDWITLATLSAATLTYNHDVSVFNCTDLFSYQVTAISTNGTHSPPSDESKIIEYFKYSEAVTDLQVIQSVIDNNKLTSLKIKFKNPLSTGCGIDKRYNISINNIQHSTPNYGVPDVNGFVTIVLSNLPETTPYVGTVVVLVQTKDTNKDIDNNYPWRDGAPASEPYVAFEEEITSISYDVYVNRVSQLMTLIWSNPINDDIQNNGWSLQKYTLYLIVNDDSDNEILLQDGLIDNTYSYTPNYIDGTYPNGTKLSFYVRATLVNNGVNYYSNDSLPKHIHTFRYASAPSVSPYWLVADDVNDQTRQMTLAMKVFNPTVVTDFSGINMIINVYDSTNNVIGTNTIGYLSNDNYGLLYFNNLPYRDNVFIEAYVTLNNSYNYNIDNINYGGFSTLEGDRSNRIQYASTSLPKFLMYDLSPIVSNNNLINTAGNIIQFAVASRDPLKQAGKFLYYDASEMVAINLSTTENQTGVTLLIVDYEVVGEEIYNVYYFTIDPSIIGATIFPAVTGIVVSNNAGVSSAQIKYVIN
jgi:hypothetical protein